MAAPTSTVVVPPVTTLTTTTLTATTELSVSTIYTTSTKYYYYDTIATRGQTVTCNGSSFSTVVTQTPSSSTSIPPTITSTLPLTTSAAPTTKIDPIIVTLSPTTTQVVTDTQLVLILSSSSYAAPYTTATVTVTPEVSSPSATPSYPLGHVVYVVAAAPSGWNSWSAGAKAGLIIGCIIAALIVLWLLLCLLKKNTEWVAHDWRWARGVEGGPSPGANVVPVVGVNGPLNARFATPYGYGYQNGAWGQNYPGWGIRGGDAERDGYVKRLLSRMRCFKGQEVMIVDEEVDGTNKEEINARKGAGNSNIR